MMIPPHLGALVRERIRSGNYVVGGHVRRHSGQEGFTVDDVLRVIEQGILIENYAERSRCLFCARVRVASGRHIWLHVVCTYNHPISIGIVTAYQPSPTEWEHPPVRRRSPGR